MHKYILIYLRVSFDFALKMRNAELARAINNAIFLAEQQEIHGYEMFDPKNPKLSVWWEIKDRIANYAPDWLVRLLGFNVPKR